MCSSCQLRQLFEISGKFEFDQVFIKSKSGEKFEFVHVFIESKINGKFEIVQV